MNIGYYVYMKVITNKMQLRGEYMLKRYFYLNKIIKSMWDGEVKVITGIRRWMDGEQKSSA